MEDVLDVQREDEELREPDGSDERHRHVRGRERAKAEDAQRQERRARARLDRDERRHERGGTAEQAERDGRAPAVGRRPGQPVDEQHQTAGDGHGAGEIEVPVRQVCAALAQEIRGQRDRDGRDPHVDQEIHDQPSYEVSTPPSRTPAAAPLPEAAP